MPRGVYIRTPEIREKQRVAATTPEALERSRVQVGVSLSPEHCRNISRGKKGKKIRPHSPEQIEKLRAVHITSEALERSRACTGDKSHNWKGGISFELYPPEFNDELKERIRERDDHVCQCCGRTREKRRDLDVHHIDHNKENCADDNLIALCGGCNGRANGNILHEYIYMRVFQQKLTNLYGY